MGVPTGDPEKGKKVINNSCQFYRLCALFLFLHVEEK